MPEMICPFCKKPWPQDFRWCMEDGSELEENKGQYADEVAEGGPGMECPECGARIDPRDEFCAGCGSRLQSAESARAIATELSCPKCGVLITMNDEFCGGCGANLLEPPAGSLPAPSADYAAPPAAAGACPNCGMQVTPGEVFCGGCGFNMSQAPAPQQAYAASQPAPASAASSVCPNCGMEIGPGETFCGTCGFNLAQAEAPAPAAPAYAPPAPEPVQQTYAAPAGGCPNCGMEVTPGEAFCGTCGFNMSQASAAPVQQEHTPPPEPAQQAYSAPAPAGSCPNCGMEIGPEETFCGTCGFNLSPAQPAAPPQEMAPPPSAGAAAGCPNCGMEIAPGETFCGTCGFNLSKPSLSSLPDDLVQIKPSQETSAAPAASCPSCGMMIAPEETFCGSCGYSLIASPAAAAYNPPAQPQETYTPPAPPEEYAAQAPAFDTDVPVPGATVKLACSQCGSTRTSQGGMFCADCGTMVGEDSDIGPSFNDPTPQSAPTISLGDVTGDWLICPTCGVEGAPDSGTCFACGTPLARQAELLAAQPPIVEETAWQEPPAPHAQPEFSPHQYPHPEPEPLAAEPAFAPPQAWPEPAPVDPAAAANPICVECGGMASPSDAVCPTCGGVLIAPEPVASFTPAAAPPPPPAPVAKPAHAPFVETKKPGLVDFSAGGKVCTCCGTDNTPDAPFCASCGVDFD